MLYLDDIVIYSSSEDEHFGYLGEVFQHLRHYNMTMNPSKYILGMCSVKLLGYAVSTEGLQVDPNKVAATSRMQAPKNIPGIRSFLGMADYYRSCIQDL